MLRYSLLLLTSLLSLSVVGQSRYWIDTDSGNEMDDLYAITYALLYQPEAISGIIATHYNTAQLLTDSLWQDVATDTLITVEESHRLNTKLLGHLGQTALPQYRGAVRMLGYGWGYYSGAPVPQAAGIDALVRAARQASPADKLNLICLGPMTNLAAALVQAPDIAPRIRLYALAAKYDARRRIWDKNEFNVRNDLNAFDYVLNTPTLECWIMPATTAEALTLSRVGDLDRLYVLDHPAARMLADRWATVGAESEWIMWDLALVLAIFHPELAQVRRRRVPPEHLRRRIQVYTEVDAKAMREEFWRIVGNGFKQRGGR